MKAYFIFDKRGNVVGSPIGYTTAKGAEKSLEGTDEWHILLRPYEYVYHGRDGISEEFKATGFYEYSESGQCWLFKRINWEKKIWRPYVKDNYKIVEKEFEITFKEGKNKTFRTLEHGDRVLLKGVVFNNDCDVTIDDHNYTRERICKDVEVKVTSSPSYESVFGGDELYFWAEYGESKEPIRCVFGKADLDKTESGNMVIISEKENGEA